MVDFERSTERLTLKRLLYNYGLLWWGPLLALIVIGLLLS